MWTTFCGLALVCFGGLPLNQHDLPYLPEHHARSFGQKLTLPFRSSLRIWGSLHYFKYYHFAASNIDAIAKSLGWSTGTANPALRTADRIIVLHIPVDELCYRRLSRRCETAREIPSISNCSSLCFRIRSLDRSFATRLSPSRSDIEASLRKVCAGRIVILLGMSKKVLLANPMGHVADASFAAATMRWNDAWYGVFSYAFQIYFDFSAYSEMAVGLGLMLGFYFMKNFDQPVPVAEYH